MRIGWQDFWVDNPELDKQLVKLEFSNDLYKGFLMKFLAREYILTFPIGSVAGVVSVLNALL